jgi:phospho-N-acetylmuramoyl-pentapeptide-transferase
VAAALFGVSNQHPLRIPWTGKAYELGAWCIPLYAVCLVGFSNAVNLTDGMDGLAAGTCAIAFIALGVLAVSVRARHLSIYSFVTVGALIAFLWHNTHPARVFMGDLGSQALGASLAAVAGLGGYWLLLPLIGIVFVIEALSVIFQVTYFKLTKKRYGEGRRIFRMSPIHYHYELGGWSETQVVTRLWIVATGGAMLGIAIGAIRG